MSAPASTAGAAPRMLWVGLPAYNEEANLRPVVERALAVLPGFVDTFEVIVVDDGSKDLTGRIKAGQLIKELAAIVGGGGGGRPDFAEAGGKDAAKIGELLQSAPVCAASEPVAADSSRRP